ncbi:hypothetical protein B0H34DRAFT_696674 [Crassisporium funariophilum]|nr:hypothetical protein B0H34DRAFT_696674 [Crassisporium funariophilum]
MSSIMKDRRCMFFDNDGHIIYKGCNRAAAECKFVHPIDPEWDCAKLNRIIPPPPYGWTGPLYRPTRGNDYFPTRDSGDTRRRPSSRSRSRSRTRTPENRQRRDSIASSSHSHETTVPKLLRRMNVDETSPAISNNPPRNDVTKPASNATSNIQQPKVQQALAPNPFSHLHSPNTGQQQPQGSWTPNLYAPPPTPPMSASDHSKSFAALSIALPARLTPSAIITSPRLPLRPRSDIARQTPSVPHTPTSPGFQVQSPVYPPAPKESAPVQPPPPPPDLPPSLALASGSPVRDPSLEEKRSMWETRLNILADSERARERLAELEEDSTHAENIVGTKFFALLPEADQKRLTKELADIQRQREEARRAHQNALDKLLKSDSWPMVPPAVDDRMDEKHAEIVQYIKELKDMTGEMSKILGDIAVFRPPPSISWAGEDDADENAQNDMAMDIDQGAPATSRKRRRLSENLEGPDGGHAQMPSQGELNDFLERLVLLEGETSTLQNDSNAHNQEMRAEFEDLLEAKMEELNLTRADEEKKAREEEEQVLNGVRRDIDQTGQEVGELANEIADLIVRVGAMEVDLDKEKRERQESFDKVLQVEQRLQEYTSTRETNARTIQTFQAALAAYTSRPPSPPASPRMPSSTYILQSLEEPLVQAMRSNIMPVVEEVRGQMEKLVQAQSEELYKTLWGRINMTLKVLETIQSKIDEDSVGSRQAAQALAGSVVQQ